ncbi:hypothetical protein L1987_50483 [Smallanthus sonchifolius]|uniref:Uncharacterized protein n=1 Tax=Smallanthus sonchifolius TaxID=185202 RepID=A0ACB9ENA6_9ASTR|nr:hypothetical protein L1987_50483 [Smallanthus sonchifolius]
MTVIRHTGDVEDNEVAGKGTVVTIFRRGLGVPNTLISNMPEQNHERNTGCDGQIVEVEGGYGEQNHERNTIHFYNIQDRLGYDRPSKAVDWLIRKAKASINELPAAPIVNIVNGNLNHLQLRQLAGHPDDYVVDNHMGNAQNSCFLPASLAFSTPSKLLSRKSSQKQNLKLSSIS